MNFLDNFMKFHVMGLMNREHYWTNRDKENVLVYFYEMQVSYSGIYGSGWSIGRNDETTQRHEQYKLSLICYYLLDKVCTSRSQWDPIRYWTAAQQISGGSKDAWLPIGNVTVRKRMWASPWNSLWHRFRGDHLQWHSSPNWCTNECSNTVRRLKYIF